MRARTFATHSIHACKIPSSECVGCSKQPPLFHSFAQVDKSIEVILAQHLLCIFTANPPVRKMMYGFGDVSAPVEASVEVLEDLVCEFILTVVANAMANSKRKGSFKIEDLLFVLRSDRKKYLRIKVIKHASLFSLWRENWRVLLSCHEHHLMPSFTYFLYARCISTEVLNKVATS